MIDKLNKDFQNSFWSADSKEKQRLVALGKEIMARIGEKLMKEFRDQLPNMNSNQLHTYRNS